MICDLCKLLHNPLKRDMLLRIYTSRDGMNVGILSDEMGHMGLVPSGVSQYLKELQGVGVIRRQRAGRYVNYYPNPHIASTDIGHAVQAFVTEGQHLEASHLDMVFGALMNPFRAHVIAILSKEGALSAIDLCERTGHQPRYLKRDLQAAVDAGLIWADDSETANAVYHFHQPEDPFVRLLVSLCQSALQIFRLPPHAADGI